MASADRSLVEAMFRALAVAQTQRIGRVDIEAASPEGIDGLTILALPKQLADHVAAHLQAWPVVDVGRTMQ